ncbi:unnamed protein product [Didymodactylos carnosus]|uniref:Cyclin-like domain-containing protein n=1 Tax=Didymodactylos carnosus TaxID=1234261 RepID=A0A813P5Q6_9BILA|nr:unnamed protein product [Didymodactylos carnosus]CAF0774984.1 unnamed protein product [Didymodactylos carnosus]CAF3526834.1 unnamed protein product [Didymodactylos carnosus]CAF3556098.1 unnamed protein product [Didymodactylos carnosus]
MPESTYGSVILTLGNVLLPNEKLYPNPTPSMQEGLSWDIEYDLRLLGCELIQTAGLLLKLPQTAVATGQVLFHRYFYSSSFIKRPMEIIAMACTNLAAKIEENARRVRDVINVFNHIKQVRAGKTIRPLLIDQNYIDKKLEVIKSERRILKELGFCVYVKHPHKMITMYLKVLEKERERKFVQTAWNYMNDSLRTDIFLRFTPESIACACIDLAARNLQIPLPKSPSWFVIFGAKEDEIRYIMIAILRLYKHRPKPFDDLEKIVNSLRDKIQDERKKLRETHLNEQIIKQHQISDSTSASMSTTVISMQSTILQDDASMAMTTHTETMKTILTTVKTSNGDKADNVTKIKSHRNIDEDSSRESTVNDHYRSSSRSSRKRSSRSSRSPIPQKKKKYRSPSKSRKQKDKRRLRNRSRSSNGRKKDKKRRSRTSTVSPDNNYLNNQDKRHKSHRTASILSTKDTNNTKHHHHHHRHQSLEEKQTSQNGYLTSHYHKKSSYRN